MVIQYKVEYIELEGYHNNGIDSVRVICTKCGHYVEVHGTSMKSIKRGYIMLREECPKKENNFYKYIEKEENE